VFLKIAAALLCLGVCSACDKNDPEAPPGNPTGGERVTGNERFGWNQSAADLAELAGIRYALYVDSARMELTDVQCDQTSTSTVFPCSAPLPRLTTGAHLLELASFVVDGNTVLEGARSAGLNVIVGSTPLSATPPDPLDSLHGVELTTLDGVALRLESIAERLADPVDVAIAPDGRLFVAEANATIRIVNPGPRSDESSGVRSVSIASAPGDRLLAIALDPAFRDTRQLFALLSIAGTDGTRSSRPTFLVARFLEREGALVDRITLIDDVPAARVPHGSLRFGPDGKLYVALDDGGAADRAGDLASRNGKLLRMNADGSTPDDQANLTPVLSFGFRAPRALSWQPASGGPWLADQSGTGEPLLYALARRAPRERSRVRAAFRLPAGTAPSATLFYRGRTIPSFENNLFVASSSNSPLLRFTFAADDPLAIVATERLLDSQVGSLRVVAQGPDGIMYLATSTTLARVIPSSR